MSRTLFRYIFVDLLKIFGLAVGVLSAIMSFAGLLKPLYEFGLSVVQVSQILTWSTPAMWAYSLPIGALFATTIVYGRLGADNEVTACRAAGISHLALALPALVLGLVTAVISLALLCFVVPYSTLKVERIIYSNLAQLAAGQIERNHQIRLPQGDRPWTVFAQEARILPGDPDRPFDQSLQLIGPMIVQYEPTKRGEPWVPETFYMARSAKADIRQDPQTDDVTLEVSLDNGVSIPRSLTRRGQRGMQISVRTQSLAPIPLDSPVRENTKFMDIFRLRDVLAHPENSRRVKSALRDFIRRDQQKQYLDQLAAELNGEQAATDLVSGAETYRLIGGGAPVEQQKDRLILGPNPSGDPVMLVQTRGAQTPISVEASEIRVRAFPDTERQRIDLSIEMIDAVVSVGGDRNPRGDNFARRLIVAMPEKIVELTNRSAQSYVQSTISDDDRSRLLRDMRKLHNSAVSELHARFSFAISCLILVMIGCALGMMFRSGNFLSAFAISVIPALMCIALIVTGQHTCENVPSPMPANWKNPLDFGLAVIWSGNIAVLTIATALLTRLQRQ